jgi:STELLO glycosyltransferase-like protein
MNSSSALIVTSIAAPNSVMEDLARGALEHGCEFIVVGDTKSPPDFQLEGCRYYSVDDQLATGLAFAQECPTRHYARKNIGYLLAIKGGAQQILETDDDNFPRPAFWADRKREHEVPVVRDAGWVNVYRYFSDAPLWPRGLPLDAVQVDGPPLDTLDRETVPCPIQQGLADENPDVDAIYRLVLPLPQNFRQGISLALGNGAWCPFNSQNTTFFPEAYPLLYLPAHCSFRMTDIWRSFVAQRIAWANGWSILFESPTVWQERNDHSLMRDFTDELPGYLNNRKIGEELDALTLKAGADHLLDNLRKCYERLVALELVGQGELELIDAWSADLSALG